jgi:hypothetical protein
MKKLGGLFAVEKAVPLESFAVLISSNLFAAMGTALLVNEVGLCGFRGSGTDVAVR